MSADQLLQYGTQAIFLGIAVVVGVRAYRRPSRVNLDVVLLFGATALIIAQSWAVEALGLRGDRVLDVIGGSLLMLLPYLMLRLVDDFADPPRGVMRLAEGGSLLSVLSLALIPPPLPSAMTLALVLYFLGLQVYAAVVFILEARRSSGVTQRRMQAVAAGSVCLGLAILVAGFQALWPILLELWTPLGRIFGLASGLGFFHGFTPPAWLRRAWQEPELRAFLGRAASLPRLPDTNAIVRELQRGAAASLGAPGAAIGLWVEAAGVLRFGPGAGRLALAPGETLAGQAFASQWALLSNDATRDDPGNAELYRRYGARAILAAPITAGERKLGVLAVYAPRAPVFAEDDLVLVQMLADQAAVILESRALIDEAARVRAREEATRLKDDFLSSAAHDLKTPLTVLVTQAQLMERRALRDPAAPIDLAGVRRIIGEARRLNRLVLELLDASRLEQGGLLGPREPVDLAEVARQICERHDDALHPCRLDAPRPVVAELDPTRIGQLVENLIENAVKYSPDGGEIEVRVWDEADQARLTVTDRGIGIPPEDLPRLFERFHRGSNVDDRRFAGMGLGLFICRGIAEQHGGRIWVGNPPGQGSRFEVALPLAANQAAGSAPSPAIGGRGHE